MKQGRLYEFYEKCDFKIKRFTINLFSIANLTEIPILSTIPNWDVIFIFLILSYLKILYEQGQVDRLLRSRNRVRHDLCRRNHT